MNEPTAGEIWKLREELERDASAILGRAIFGFSRLDMNLGLMVASILRVSGRPDQAQKVDEMNFHKRLEFVSRYVLETPAIDPRASEVMTSWLRSADQLRTQRNELVHGRWGVDPYKRKALNIVGLPSSGAQRTIEYTLEELEAFVQRTQELQASLSKARSTWQLP
jgi:hypothetical protein